MKLLPDTTGMRAFLGWLNYEKYKEGAQFQEVQRVLISTNQNREPKGSIYLETFFEQQWQQKPSSPSNGLPMRCQSEEPAMKKRKHFMVDTEELEEASRVVKACRIPVKPVTKPVVKEVISLVDEEKYDPPWLEPGVIYTLEQRVQYHKDREKAKEDARLAAAARNAQQPQPQKEGPFTTIHDRRDEHEKKQRAEAAANKRRFSLVNNSLRGDSMTKSSIPSGVRPTNRLGQSKPQQASQRDSKEPWSRPSHIPPFKHLTIADKKQRTDHGSVITKSSPASPIDLDEDTLDRQGHDSVARSGYSHTMNESQKNTTRREMYVDEFRSSEDITKINSKRPRQRRNGHSNGVGNGGGTHKYRIPNGSIINAGDREDSADPIVDPEIELIGKRAFKKSSVLEVQIPSYEPNIYNQSRNHPDSNANAKSIRNKGIFPSTSETPLSSPHFAMFGDDDHKKSSKARQTSKLMAANGNPRSMGQDGRVSTSNAPRSSHPDTGLDELGEDQFEPGERSDFETAQALIRKQKATREQRPPSQHESINLDDSDEDNSAEANIIPTQFKTESKNPDVVGTYELRQLFSRPKIWLRDTDKKTWTMTLNKKIHCLQSFDEQGNTNLSFLTNPFKFFEWHKESSKVAIHRPRDHQASNGTEIFLEFSSLGQREQFVKDMRAVYKTLNVIHIQKEDGKEYLDKVFNKAIESHDNRSCLGPQTSLKRSREEEEDPQLQLAKANSERKYGAIFKERQGSKRPRIAGPDGPHPEQNDEVAPRKHGLAKSMKVEPREAIGDEVTPAHFYGRSTSGLVDEGISHATRSSTRVAGTRAAASPAVKYRSPSPEIPSGWTTLNPNWAKEYNWRGSIVYPPQGKSRVAIDKQDIYRLDEGEFLNDNLVTFYLFWLENRLEERNPDVAKRIYFHNSFFFEKLSKPAKGSKDIINYEAVKKWTAKVNLFDYDYIVVPVNENFHWYVAIICNAPRLVRDAEAAEKAKLELDSQDEASSDDTGKVIAELKDASPSPNSSLTPQTQGLSLNEKMAEEFDPEPYKRVGKAAADQKPVLSPEIDPGHQGSSSSPPPIVSDIVPSDPKANQPKKGKKKGPPPRKHDPSAFRIITLDSFHGAHSPCCTKLKKYLLQEMKTKLHIEAQDPGSVGMTAKNIPVQSNYSDCGLFLLNYIEEFLKNPNGFIHEILQNSLDIEKEWPPASETRNKVRNLLFELQREQHGGGKLGKEGGKSKPTTRVEKNIDTGSTRGTSAQPSRSSKAPPVPGNQEQTNVAADKAHSKKMQPTKAAEPEPVKIKPVQNLTTLRNNHDIDQQRNNLLEPSHKQGGIKAIYTSLANSFSTVSNGILRRSRNTSESDAREQAPQGREVIEIENSTQHSSFYAEADPADGQRLEISDSQAPSSGSTSVEGERSSSQGRRSPMNPIEIPESPEPKAVKKAALGQRSRGTEQLESPTPPEDRPHLRNYHDDLKHIALGSPSPEPEFNGFPSDLEKTMADDDEIELVKPFSPPSSGEASRRDEEQRTDDEMLFPNGQRGKPSGTREDPESIMSSPPVSASTPARTSQEARSSKSTPTSPTPRHQSIEEGGGPKVPKGRKRKSLTDEEDVEHYRRPSPEFRAGSSSAIISENTRKKRKSRPEDNGYSQRHPGETQSFYRDASDQAVIGVQRSFSHPHQ